MTDASAPLSTADLKQLVANHETCWDVYPLYTDHSIELFDHSIAESSRRRFRDEVQLKIAVTHHKGYHQPVDASEVQCLRSIEHALGELGACKGHWKPALSCPPPTGASAAGTGTRRAIHRRGRRPEPSPQVHR